MDDEEGELGVQCVAAPVRDSYGAFQAELSAARTVRQCYGCLIVEVRGDQAANLCNECAAVIRTIPVGDIDAVMLNWRKRIRSAARGARIATP